MIFYKKLKIYQENFDIHTLEILNKSSKTSIVRGLGMLFNMLISIVLGRLLGPEGFGIINLSNQIIIILLMMIMMGFPTVILKEVAIAYNRKNWARSQSVINTSFKTLGVITLVVLIISLLLTPFICENIFKEPKLEIPLTIAIFAMLFQVISRIYAAGVNGYGKIWQSSLVDQTLSLFIVILGIGLLYILNYQITIVSIAWVYAIARAIVAMTIGWYWMKIRVFTSESSFIPKQLFKTALPLLFVQATNTIASSVDTIMVGTYMNAESVGFYSVALRIAFVSSFFLQVTNASLSPKIASMFANKQISEMETTIQKITKGLFYTSIIILAIIVFAGKPILGLWGPDFKIAYWSLLILSAGQFVNVSAGCVGLVLTLCGQQKIWGITTFSAAIINIVLNVIFIKLWGIIGAALATSINLIYLNIFGIIMVKKRLKIDSVPFVNNLFKS